MTDLIPAGYPTWGDVHRIAQLTGQWLDGRKSAHTRAAYRNDLKSWLGWCRANDLPPLTARPGDIMSWLADLAEGDPDMGREPERGTTRARRLGAVSSWYRWLIRHDAAALNPGLLDKAERPVLAPRNAPALSDDQAEKLLKAADQDPNPRSAAMVWLLFTTGVRVAELIAANVSDIGSTRGVTVLHVHGKGGKTRMVEVEPYTMHRVTTYLESRADVNRLPVPAAQAGAGAVRPLIVTSEGNRIDRNEVRRLLRRLAKAAGLPAELAATLTPHTTRATFVTTSLEDGVPVRDVQRAVGHASPVTTEAYDRSAWSPDRSPSRRVARRFHAARIDAQQQDPTTPPDSPTHQ